MMFTLIRQAHVYAPKDLGIKDVLICNDKIIAVEDSVTLDFSWDEQITTIDGTLKYLVPGFIDQHVHIIGGGGEDGFASLIPEIQMTDCIKAGVTTVVGLLGTDSNAKSIPALVAKTKALKEQGISAFCLTGSYAYPSTTLTGSVSKDIAFVEEIIGVKIAISDHRSSNVSKEELARLATQARTAGLLAGKPGVVHMHTGRGKIGYRDVLEIVKETDIPVSQFRPTHAGTQLESAFAFAEAGGMLDFTSGNDTKRTAQLLAEVLKQVQSDRVTLSSDSNGSFPIWNDKAEVIGMGIGKMTTLYQTIRDLIQIEKVPIETALTLITKNVAKGLMQYPKKGCIARGSDADLVLLDQALTIDSVIAKGVCMMREKQMLAKDYYNNLSRE